MLRRAHLAVLVAIVAGTLIPLSAHADVFVWIDAVGVRNVSNLPPPDGVRLVSVTRAAPKDPAQEAAFRDAAREAEMRALKERVQQLQSEVEQVRREPSPPVAVLQPQAPPTPYVIVVSPPPASVPVPVYAEPASGCAYPWSNCGFGFWPGFYPANVVVVRDRHFRHDRFRHDHPIQHGLPRLVGGMGIPAKPPGRKP